MNRTIPTTPEDRIPVGSQKGFIAFCETNLRYEKGVKAWIILGPYLLGALLLERLAATSVDPLIKTAAWAAFLTFLILFPDAWQRLLRWRNSRKALPKASSAPEQV